MYGFEKKFQKLIETSNVEEASWYAENGWLLLSTHVTGGGDPYGRNERTVYSLGYPLKGDGSRPPEPTAEEREGMTVLGRFALDARATEAAKETGDDQ